MFLNQSISSSFILVTTRNARTTVLLESSVHRHLSSKLWTISAVDYLVFILALPCLIAMQPYLTFCLLLALVVNFEAVMIVTCRNHPVMKNIDAFKSPMLENVSLAAKCMCFA